MSSTTEHDSQPLARSVFAGLAPSTPLPAPDSTSHDRDRRASKALFSTGVVLVGAMTVMNLTGQVQPVHADKPQGKPKGISAFGKTLRDAVATVRTSVTGPQAASVAAADAPTTYRVAAGDTVSGIATRYGLSTASVLALNGLGWSSLIFPGQVLKLTNSGPVPSAAVADEGSVSSGRYTIVSGDTISAIAARFGVSTQSVLTANGLGWSSIIYPGQSIAIPGLVGPDGAQDIPAPEASAPVVEAVVEAPVVEAPVVQPVVEPEPAPAPPAPASGTYTIASGDTVSSIATRFGVSTDALLAANGLDWSSIIYTGHTLMIPGGGASVSGPDLGDRALGRERGQRGDHHPGRPRPRRQRPRHRHRARHRDAGVETAQPRLGRPRLGRAVPAAPEHGLGHGRAAHRPVRTRPGSSSAAPSNPNGG